MKTWLLTPGAALAALVLAGCGGGGSAGSGGGGGFSSLRCETISGGSAQTVATVEDGCANCSVTDAANVADSSIQTFAVLDATNAPQGVGVKIRSTAQQGIVYPSGLRVSAFARYAETATEGIEAEAIVTLRTFLAGGLQEEQSTGDADCSSNCGLTRQQLGIGLDENTPDSFLWFRSSFAFDAVEIHYSAPGLHSGDATLRVHGLCRDGGVGS